MKRATFLMLWAGLAFALTGFPGAGADTYPMEITGVADTADYPVSTAGFERVSIYHYGPGNADISVGYNMLTPETQIVSTIYITNASVFPGLLNEQDPLGALFGAYKAGVLEYHPGGQLLGEDSVTLTKNGKQYNALRVIFRYDEDFQSKRQPVYSVMMLWRNGDDFIKLRSTGPLAQSNLSESNNMNLLDAVNWTTPPV